MTLHHGPFSSHSLEARASGEESTRSPPHDLFTLLSALSSFLELEALLIPVAGGGGVGALDGIYVVPRNCIRCSLYPTIFPAGHSHSETDVTATCLLPLLSCGWPGLETGHGLCAVCV